MPVTRGGQISIPAEIRKRWGAAKVYVQDCGDHIEVRPAPDDPIGALAGSLKMPPGLTVDELTREYRREDVAAENRKWREYFGDERATLPLPE